MAKKKKEEDKKKQLPSIIENQMVISPSEIVKFMAGLSPLAIEIFGHLLLQFKGVMVEQLKAKAENRQYSLFDDEIIPMVRIQMSHLSVEAYDYHRIEIAVAELFNQVYHTSARNKWGDEVDRYVRLFQVCEIPKRKLGYTEEANDERYNYKSGVRRRGYIAMQFTQEAAPLMLTIGESFTKFWIESLVGWRNKHTPGMVLTLSPVVDYGAWTVKYDELRRRLGFIKPVLITDNNTKGANSMYAEKDFGYTNFSDMRRRVLDPVMNEIKKGCESGRAVPFYFEYEPNYADGKTRGVPNSITFKIHKSEFGRMMNTESERIKEKNEIREFLTKNLKIGKTSAAALSLLVTDENKVGFRKKMIELHSIISDPKNTIKDVGAYCVVALKNWIETSAPATLYKSPTVDGEYEDVTNTPNAENVCDLSPNEEPKEINGRWDGALGEMQLNIQSKDMEYILSDLQYVLFEADVLTLSTPPGNKFFEQWITQQWNYREQYLAAVRSHFGENVKIVYVMRKF